MMGLHIIQSKEETHGALPLHSHAQLCEERRDVPKACEEVQQNK
jgi:hypothetical protein